MLFRVYRHLIANRVATGGMIGRGAYQMRTLRYRCMYSIKVQHKYTQNEPWKVPPAQNSPSNFGQIELLALSVCIPIAQPIQHIVTLYNSITCQFCNNICSCEQHWLVQLVQLFSPPKPCMGQN